jgi:hypothetical protein
MRTTGLRAAGGKVKRARDVEVGDVLYFDGEWVEAADIHQQAAEADQFYILLRTVHGPNGSLERGWRRLHGEYRCEVI